MPNADSGTFTVDADAVPPRPIHARRCCSPVPVAGLSMRRSSPSWRTARKPWSDVMTTRWMPAWSSLATAVWSTLRVRVERAPARRELVRLAVGVDLCRTHEHERGVADPLLQLLVRELSDVVEDEIDHFPVRVLEPLHTVLRRP